ncbi:MAG: diacylglycerol kinase [Halofilum sp. (in: g-proteobacteria)]|nr:diacylglycerol kinase [Halofilum sp. (in: g-proteobacteria)]
MPARDLTHFLHAFRYALRGLAAALRHELAFRVEVATAVVAVPVALWLGDSGLERAVLVAVVGLVPLVELLNAAIETAVDRIGTEEHPLSARAKDLGAAALLLSLAIAAAVWLLVLLG